MGRIYWANSIFGQADREFNERCVARLRAAGLHVINPQESTFNQREAGPTAREIFEVDTRQIESCDALVACIDQEAIDAGVACEIGIAWARGIRLVCLYTDIRQFRQGRYAMYKNPYVIGCIEDRGVIVDTVEDLIEVLTHDV